MVDGPKEPKRSVISLHKREFHYTLPSGEVVIVAPHKNWRGMVTLPAGTKVKMVKLTDDRFRQS